jgi:hypothetical protein
MPRRLLFVLMVSCLLYHPSASKAAPIVDPAQWGRVIGICHADLSGDGRTETVLITARSIDHGHPMGGEIIVMRGTTVIWHQPKLNPWKLQIADVDGDGRPEIIAGVWKKSPKDQVMAKRTFVYSWNGQRMLPKWLGSRLSRRFDDFTLSDINHDRWSILFALEITPNAKHRIAAYRWNVFGFDWLGRTADIAGATGLGLLNGKPVVYICGWRIPVMYARGKILIGKRYPVLPQ